jgi:hypothetical protein
MVQVIKPLQVIRERFTTQTVQGEVTVNLNLTIKIEQDGTVRINSSESTAEVSQSLFQIPEFEQEDLLSNFGKDISG